MKFLIAAIALAVGAFLLFWPILPGHAQVPSYTLHWTAPGDDGDQGRASEYSIRWSYTRPGADLSEWWRNSTAVGNPPLPGPAGTTDSVVVAPPGGFAAGDSVFFMIQAADEVPNWSGYSNVAAKYTPRPDTIPPRAIIDLR